MSAGPLTIQLLLVFIITVYFLQKYGNWRKYHPVVTIASFIAWYFSFVIVVVLPLDVALTFYNKCVHEHLDVNSSVGNASATSSTSSATQHANFSSTIKPTIFSSTCKQPGSYVSNIVLQDLWRVVYWTSQCLTWLVLPIMQSYSTSGQFTALLKLKSAVYENAIYYASYLLIVGVLLIYVAAKGFSLDGDHLMVICITASNTWGLFLLVLLLGYGLVEIPRQLWLAGHKGYSLNKTYFDLEKLSSEKNDAEESVKDAFKDAKSTLEALREGNILKECAQTIYNKFPPELVESMSRSRGLRERDSFTDTDAANLAANNENSLARLHKRVITAIQEHNRTKAQWCSLVDKALHLEEVAKNDSNPKHAREFVRSYKLQRSMAMETLCSPKIEWYWECIIKRPLFKVVSVCLSVLSVFLVWSECTFFSVRPTLSLAAIFIYSAANNYDYKYIQLSSVITIFYLCICAYYTVFKVRVYKYYHLDPHKQTDAKSLLFSAMLLCRLTPPLCLNFLGLIHLDSHVATEDKTAETAFTKIMGHMDVIPIVNSGFNIYFPILILALCFATYFKFGTLLLHSLGIDQFIGDDEMTAEFVQGGKALIQTERNRLQRESNRESRQEYWNDKLSDHDQRRRAPTPTVESRDTVPIVPLMQQEPQTPDRSFSADFMAPSNPSRYEYGSSNHNQAKGSSNQNQAKGIFDDL